MSIRPTKWERKRHFYAATYGYQCVFLSKYEITKYLTVKVLFKLNVRPMADDVRLFWLAQRLDNDNFNIFHVNNIVTFVINYYDSSYSLWVL